MKACALFLGLLLVAGTAAAAPTQKQVEKAKVHFKAAESHYNAGRYDRAVEEYLAAYEAAPLPLLLFNAAQSYRKLGDKQKAVEYYKLYLAADPKKEYSQEAADYVAKLSKDLDSEKPAPPPVAEPKIPPPATTPVPTPPPSATSPVTPPIEPQTTPADASDSRRTMRIAGLVSVGVGAAGIVAGVIFGLKARGLADEVGQQYDPDKVSSG